MPLVAVAALAEIGVRLGWTPPEDRVDARAGVMMRAHATRLWALSPGDVEAGDQHFVIDERGLRAVALTGATHRALTLGDSSIFGHGLADADTLHAALSRAFAEQGTPVDVLCGGVPGYSTEQSLALLDEVGWALSPDLLVVGDLWSDHKHESRTDRERLAAARAALGPPWLAGSAAWRWMQWLAAGRPGPREVGWDQVGAHGGRVHRVPLSDYAANLDAMLVEAAGHGASVVFLAPVNRTRFRGGDEEPTTWNIYFGAMHEVAARRGVPVVDARQAVLAAGLTEDEAFIDDLHPSARADEVLARALVAAVAPWPVEPRLPDPTPPPFTEPLVDPGLWAPAASR